MIAVTGANGLVGSFVVRKLLEQKLQVIAVVRKNSNLNSLADVQDKIILREADVLDISALAEALKGVLCVIHTAAIVSFNRRRAKRILEVNVEGTRNVVNTCLNLEIGKLIHVSSVAALGRIKGVTKIDEDSKWISSAINSDYGLSKYLAELEVFRGMEEGLSASIVNPSVVLAPTDWNNSSAQLFQYVWKERPFYTEGSLNFVDVRDLAEIIYRIYNSDKPGQKFIASAGSVSLRQFFEEIGKRFHKKPPSVKVTERWIGLAALFEAFRSRLSGTEPLVTRQSARIAREIFFYDSRKAKDLLKMDFRPMEETLDWCCEHYLRTIPQTN